VERPPAARAAMDRISHGVDFATTPIETALNWGRVPALSRFSRPREAAPSGAGASKPGKVDQGIWCEPGIKRLTRTNRTRTAQRPNSSSVSGVGVSPRRMPPWPVQDSSPPETCWW